MKAIIGAAFVLGIAWIITKTFWTIIVAGALFLGALGFLYKGKSK